jgi:DNA-binding transcriptional LysR family regulator
MLDRLTLDQLRTLIAIAECGSFSAAARKLGRVQSAVSQTVVGLERELRVELFDRSSKVPALTDAGRAILQHATEVVRSVEDLRGRAEHIAAGVEPELAVAIDHIFPNAVLMEGIAALQKKFPDVPVTIFTEGLGASEQRLREGLVRLAIYPPLDGAAPSDMAAEFLASIAFIPVVSVDHPLARRKGPISDGELRKHIQLVITDRTRRFDSTPAGAPQSPHVWRFADQYTRLEYLLKAFGWCHLAVHFAESHLRARRLKWLNLEQYNGGYVSLAVSVVYNPRRPLGPASLYLVDRLRHLFAKSMKDSAILRNRTQSHQLFHRRLVAGDGKGEQMAMPSPSDV